MGLSTTCFLAIISSLSSLALRQHLRSGTQTNAARRVSPSPSSFPPLRFGFSQEALVLHSFVRLSILLKSCQG